MKKWFRVLVALVLVCVLVVNVSPIRAEASALPEVAGVVTRVIPFAKVVEPAALGVGGTVFCWVAAGLGLAFTANQAVEAYNAYQDFTGDLETSIYYYPDGSWSYGVDVAFVDRVRAFLFDRGYVVDTGKLTTVVPEGQIYRNYTPIVPCVAYAYSYHYVVTGSYKVVSDAYLVSLIPGDPYVVSTSSWGDTYITVNGVKHYAKTVAHGINSYTKAQFEEFMSKSSDFYYLGESGGLYLQDVWNKYGWTGITGNGDVAIDYVAAPDVPMDTAYPDWYTNARPAVQPDTDEEITVLPIPLNPSADPETQIGTLTQPDIWQGSIADPMPEPEPDPDPGTETDPDGSISNTPWEDFKNWFTPSGDIDSFGIQLKDFFPFCIPYDLFDFLTCLAADPVAPVFRWEIPVPQLGQTFELEVDLSAWDDVAQLFRNLELLAFIVGLAYVTREKFLRS